MEDLLAANKALELGFTDDYIEKQFAEWGPSAGNIFDSNESFQTWAFRHTIGLGDLTEIFHDGLATEGSKWDEISDRYFHIAVDENFKQRPPRVFASKFIFNWLVNQHRSALQVDTIKLVNACAKVPFVAATWRGWMYEHLTLDRLHTISQWEVLLRGNTLKKKKSWKSVNLTWSKASFYSLSKLSYIVLDTVYVPEIRNLTAGDAFVVMEVDTKVVLVIFQVTVGATHSLKHHGLLDIKRLVEKLSRKWVDEWYVVFVVPPGSKLKIPQAYITIKNENMESQPELPLQGIFEHTLTWEEPLPPPAALTLAPEVK